MSNFPPRYPQARGFPDWKLQRSSTKLNCSPQDFLNYSQIFLNYLCSSCRPLHEFSSPVEPKRKVTASLAIFSRSLWACIIKRYKLDDLPALSRYVSPVWYSGKIDCRRLAVRNRYRADYDCVRWGNKSAARGQSSPPKLCNKFGVIKLFAATSCSLSPRPENCSQFFPRTISRSLKHCTVATIYNQRISVSTVYYVWWTNPRFCLKRVEDTCLQTKYLTML